MESLKSKIESLKLEIHELELAKKKLNIMIIKRKDTLHDLEKLTINQLDIFKDA